MKNLFFLFFLFFFTGCGLVSSLPSVSPTVSPPEKKLTVVASFYPLAFLAQEIGGDTVSVKNLAGNTEVHEYQPSPQERVLLQKTDIILFQGASLESWTHNIIPELQKKGIKTISVLNEIPSLSEIQKDASFNPHTWLDPIYEKETIAIILKAFQERDPQNAEYYQKNALILQEKFSQIDNEYKRVLQNCQKKSVVVSHNAFEYVAKRYKFQTYSLSGLSPEDEPSAENLAYLKKEIQKQGITYILAEQNTVQRFSQTLAKETGVQMLSINTLETDTEEFFTAVQKNLNSFSLALACS